MTVVLTIDPRTVEKLRAFLAKAGFHFEERPHAAFLARRPGVTLTVYESGKLVVTGAQAAEYAGVLVGNGMARGDDEATTRRRQGDDEAPGHPSSPLRRLSVASASPPGWLLHFDGACMPINPGGVSAYGFVVLRDGAIVHEGSGLAAPPGPGSTNNLAEFRGLVEGLRWLQAQGAREVLVRGDSKLVVETMLGIKQLHAPHLLALRDEARRLHMAMGGRIEWVPREQNAEADRMSRVGWKDAVAAHPEWVR